MCGKNKELLTLVDSHSGSPPRVREKPFEVRIVKFGYGITPACAGKTLFRSWDRNCWKDHPRVCGKNYRLLIVAIHLVGSPPRVREKLFRIDHEDREIRITPACAGKTYLINQTRPLGWDHPRVCGKNVDMPALIIGCIRITPACAGKTLKDPNEIKTFLSF